VRPNDRMGSIFSIHALYDHLDSFGHQSRDH
jgi:hypothetical protein